MAIGDPLARYVSALVQGLGAAGSTSFSDSSANAKTVTKAGSPVISAASPKFPGTGTIFFPSNTLSFLSLPSSDSSFTFGTSEFAVEFWLKVPSIAAGVYNYPFHMGNSQTIQLSIRINPGGQIVVDMVGAVQLLGNGVTADTWNHIAVARQGTVVRLFLNGVLLNSTANSSNFLACAQVQIGAYSANGWYSANTFMDDIRITRGAPRYTTGFSSPVARFVPYASRVSGVVRDSSGALAQRTVRVYRRDTGALLKTAVSNAVTGAYTAELAVDPGECNVVFLDDAAGTTYNDLIHRVTAY